MLARVLIFSSFLAIAFTAMISVSSFAQPALDAQLARAQNDIERAYYGCINGLGSAEFYQESCDAFTRSEGYKNPTTANEHFQRGIVLMNIFYDDDGALDAFEEAIRLDPSDARAYTGRGVVYSASDIAAATAEYDHALSLDPLEPFANLAKGVNHMRQMKYEEAIPYFGAALEGMPELISAYVNRGQALSYLNQHEEALADFNMAVWWHPDELIALESRGATLAELERFAEALADYDRAIELAPRDGWPRAMKAMLLATCADPTFRNETEALTLALEAVETAPTDGIYHATLAVAYAANGNFEQAEIEQQQALELLRVKNDPELMNEHERRLALYQNIEPYRTP